MNSNILVALKRRCFLQSDGLSTTLARCFGRQDDALVVLNKRFEEPYGVMVAWKILTVGLGSSDRK